MGNDRVRVLDSKLVAIANDRMTVSGVYLKTVRTIDCSEWRFLYVVQPIALAEKITNNRSHREAVATAPTAPTV
jgi:hypothetical protein